jgi:hypothetical protein
MRLDRSDPMTNAQEKRVNRIAELKGFRLEKGGHGKGHGRFYIMDLWSRAEKQSVLYSEDPLMRSVATAAAKGQT